MNYWMHRDSRREAARRMVCTSCPPLPERSTLVTKPLHPSPFPPRVDPLSPSAYTHALPIAIVLPRRSASFAAVAAPSLALLPGRLLLARLHCTASVNSCRRSLVSLSASVTHTTTRTDTVACVQHGQRQHIVLQCGGRPLSRREEDWRG
jgi:hypothetical protein